MISAREKAFIIRAMITRGKTIEEIMGLTGMTEDEMKMTLKSS